MRQYEILEARVHENPEDTEFNRKICDDGALKGVTLPLRPESLEVGKTVNILGNEVVVTQTGSIVCLASGIRAFTLRDVTPVEPEAKPSNPKITSAKQLRIMYEVDIFFETKEIKLNVGKGHLSKEGGVTYSALYDFLLAEWQAFSSGFPKDCRSLPIEHEGGTNNYCLINGWNWASDYNLVLRDGCWSRKDLDGRHV